MKASIAQFCRLNGPMSTSTNLLTTSTTHPQTMEATNFGCHALLKYDRRNRYDSKGGNLSFKIEGCISVGHQQMVTLLSSLSDWVLPILMCHFWHYHNSP